VGVLIAVLTLLLCALVILLVTGPLRAARRRADLLSPERGELLAAREAKYREIRDAEMDFRTGKLSRSDYELIDRELRAEALEILNRLERLEAEELSHGPTPASEEVRRGG
jgi:hypothetical protein